MKSLYQFVVAGNQKAIVGGLVAGVLSLLTMVNISGQMTVREALFAIGTWLVTHSLVWFKANKG